MAPRPYRTVDETRPTLTWNPSRRANGVYLIDGSRTRRSRNPGYPYHRIHKCCGKKSHQRHLVLAGFFVNSGALTISSCFPRVTDNLQVCMYVVSSFFNGVRRNLYADSVISPDMAALEELLRKHLPHLLFLTLAPH